MNELDADEIERVVGAGMSVAWCPSAAMTIGTGATIHGSHLEMLRRGVNTSLGSDGPNSSCRYDVGLQGLLTVVSAREKKIRAAMALEDVLDGDDQRCAFDRRAGCAGLATRPHTSGYTAICATRKVADCCGGRRRSPSRAHR